MGIDLGDVAAKEKVFIIRMRKETESACKATSYNDFIYTRKILCFFYG